MAVDATVAAVAQPVADRRAATEMAKAMAVHVRPNHATIL
jgi:hypothetical protein